MGFKTAANAVLTENQAQITSKIGSMKSLLALPIRKKNNIPKNQQISTFDYLIKILNSLGINPEIVFQLFVNKVFDTASTFLEDKVVDAVGAALDAKNIKLSNDKSNADVIRGVIPKNFLVTVKLKIAKELTIMIFGPKNGPSAEILVPDPIRRNQLIDEAICGYNMFSISNNPTIRNEDIEFNRIKLKQQLEKGEVVFEISCQDVKIKLPEDPGFLFGEGGATNIQNRITKPSDSILLLVQYVNNRTQQINNQQNSQQTGRRFFEILIEKLLSYITTLVIPYLGAIFSFLKTQPQTSSLNPDNLLYGSCAILGNNNNETTAFSKSLMNAFYKELVKGMLLFAINEFKKLLKSYFARTAFEKIKRRTDKIRLKFKIFGNSSGDSSATRFKKAMDSLKSILD